MSAKHRPLAVALAALALAGPAWAQQAPDQRSDFEAFGVALDRALARISRPLAGAFLPAAEPSSRGYHLQGYGAVFVVPARALPSARRRAQEAEAARALDQATRRLEEAMTSVDSAELRRRMEASLQALRETQAELRRSDSRGEKEMPPLPGLPDPGEDPNLEPEIASQVEALRRDAEQAQSAVERSLAEIERQVRARLAPLREPPAPVAAPAFPAVPLPPAPPDPPAPPPWSFWFEHEEADGRSPERVIHDVGEAVAAVLESHGAGLRVLRPEEAVVVAVDFVPRQGRLVAGWGPAAPPARAERTLVVRVRKRELDARRAGKLALEELRERIEYLEY